MIFKSTYHVQLPMALNLFTSSLESHFRVMIL